MRLSSVVGMFISYCPRINTYGQDDLFVHFPVRTLVLPLKSFSTENPAFWGQGTIGGAVSRRDRAEAGFNGREVKLYFRLDGLS